MIIRPSLLVLTTSLSLSSFLFAQGEEGGKQATHAAAPILDALNSVDADARRFNEHIVILSSPFLEGRLPGTRGMEIAKEYMEFWYKDAGLVPPFASEGGGKSFRQPFPLSSTPKVTGSSMQVPGQNLNAKTDYAAHETAGGKASAPLVSVGYSIRRGRDGYNSYPENTDIRGKIALILRGRPMGESDARWRASRRYSVQVKVMSAVRAGAAGVIIVTPSFVEGQELVTTRHRRTNIPVMAMTRSAANYMLRAIGADQDIDALAKANDKAGVVTPLGDKPVTIEVQTKVERLIAENVAGVLPGRGSLAKELVIIGGHLDHLGKGNFGSRSPNRGKVLHPGADDNASGSAGVLMIADKMARAYKAMGPDQPARSVMFVGFSAEESGLHGSRYMAANPLPGYKTALMINFDMIGRVRNNSVMVGGAGTAKGLLELVTPICERSPINARINPGAGGGSDHLNFLRKGIPVLMGHSGQHSDYHTERDVSDKINRVGGAQVSKLFAELGLAVATWDVTIEFQQTARRRRGR